MVKRRSTAFDWEIVNQVQIEQYLDNLAGIVEDLRPALIPISLDWYKSNRKLFTLKSKGLYQDLAPAAGIDGNPTTTSNYKDQKKRRLGFTYPILIGETGALAASILSKNHQFSIFNIGKRTLEMGTSIPYGKYHQSDGARGTIPQRKFVFIDGGPADKSADSSISGRRERWLNIINDQIIQAINGEVL